MKTTHSESTPAARRGRRWRSMVWSMAFMLFAAMALPLGGYLYASLQAPANAQEVTDTNPRANYWRAVREGVSGYTAVSGQETNVLMQNGGQNWRALRNGPIATYGAYVMAAMLAIIVVFFLVRGRIKLDAPRTGRKVKRWNVFERTVHWCTATLFVILGITGLSLLFGKAVLIPVLGPKGFALWADLGSSVHNYLGPVFTGLVTIIILMWVRHNLPTAHDGAWFKSGGGMIGKGHPHAGRMNGGEKVWFWFIATAGVAVCVSGLVMNFPNFGQPRETMQLANLVHAGLSMVWIAIFFGHAYIATLGTEGALEGMTTGEVDEAWAKQHHDLWYEEVQHKQGDEGQAATPAGMAPQQG